MCKVASLTDTLFLSRSLSLSSTSYTLFLSRASHVESLSLSRILSLRILIFCPYFNRNAS
jgi:hypothetical protein